MKYLLAFLLVSFVIGAACTLPVAPYGYASYQDVPPATCHSDFAATYEASEFQDPGERSQLMAAGTAWGDLSKGQVAFTITFDPDAPGAHHIHRVLAADKVVTDYEATQGHLQGDGHIAGWHADSEDIYLVVDRVPAGLNGLQALAEHELGHGAHLAWPLCVLSHSECIHSPDPNAVMAPVLLPNVVTLTPSDLALCRASCLCP
jgi:hypothetical protein